MVESPFADVGEEGFTYDLTVDVGGQTAARRAAFETSRARARGERVLFDAPREVVAATGDPGLEVAFLETGVPMRFRRSVFFDRPGGGTLQIRVLSFVHPADDPELDALVGAFEVLDPP